MKMKQLLSAIAFGMLTTEMVNAQGTTSCPAPNPGDPNCFQTSRPSNGNPLVNWPPFPNQDCCNALTLGLPYNEVENGSVIPEGAPAGTLYPGCVDGELPNPNNTCFSNNEKGTMWFKVEIYPLNIPGSPTAIGSPAGKLRFKIIPNDVLDSPDYDPFTDNGSNSYGNTDYDFMVFKIPSTITSDGAICTAIRNSTTFTDPSSVIASCNWTGTRGPTGLFEPGTGTEFAQGPATRFNQPLDVRVGDVYIIAIDNFSVNTQGFDVDFRGLEAPDDESAVVYSPTGFSSQPERNPVKLNFQNPVSGNQIRLPDNVISVCISNALGQMVALNNFYSGNDELDISNLTNGIYQIQLNIQNRIHNSRLLIQR
jgi:hypothetical protein